MKSSIASLEAEQERRLGLPSGLLGSIRQQETGGKQSYLDDPTKYHYGLNSEGRRVAGHTGKISTAFGPYGLLESTGNDPGYGVKPLSSKDLAEQVRFAAEYLGGRINNAGSVEKGLAGYGEGSKYANQVLKRIGGTSTQTPAPVVMAQAAPVALPQGAAQLPEQQIVPPSIQAQTQAPSVMAAMTLPQQEAQPVLQQMAAAQYMSGLEAYGRGANGEKVEAAPAAKLYRPENQVVDLGIQIPQFNLPMVPTSQVPNMQAFAGWGGAPKRYS